MPNVPLSIANWALKVHKGVEIKLKDTVLYSAAVSSGVARVQPMPGHSVGILHLRVALYPGLAQLSADCSTEMQKQLGGSEF